MQNPADDESPTLKCQRELTALSCLIITNTYPLYSFLNVESSMDANSSDSLLYR